MYMTSKRVLISFARWCHFTTTTRILQGFAFLFKLSFCYRNLTAITKFKYERKNEINSGLTNKKDVMCKWPIKWFAKIPNSDGSLVLRRLHDNGHTFDRGEKNLHLGPTTL